MGRDPVEEIHAADYRFQWGKSEILREGRDVAIIAAGIMVHKALEAADILKSRGIQAMVINMHTIKPIDVAGIVAAAKKTGFIVTAEEHTVLGGLGSAVAEVLVRQCPVRQAFVGVQDQFGESGSASELLEKYGLTARNIVENVMLGIRS
ncbi:Transketolase, C-terminal subunit [Megasphaera cerevisiae DSM 20462]|nr:Transketolase, C-terminal subunit [Megasphaera cerevisiae DSM 20462]